MNKLRQGHDKNYVFRRAGFAHILIVILLTLVVLLVVVIFLPSNSEDLDRIQNQKMQPEEVAEDYITEELAEKIIPLPTESLKTYVNDKYGFSFEYPSESGEVWVDAGGDGPDPDPTTTAYVFSETDDAWITFSAVKNSQNLSAKEYYQKTKSEYNQNYINEIYSDTFGETQILVLAQPLSCKTAALMTSMVSHGDIVLVLTQIATDKRQSAIETFTILNSLSFNDESAFNDKLERSIFVFPQDNETDCN